MSRVDAAAPDRLPWLPDEPEAPTRRRRNAVFPLAATAVAAVAAFGFWMGAQSIDQQPAASRHAAPTTTVRLPEPRPVQPDVRLPAEQQVIPAPEREVRPAPVHEVRIAPPPPVAHAAREEPNAPPIRKEVEQASPPPTAAPAPAFVMPKPWNPRVFAGASGRVVQIGAFGSVRQSKQGWWHMVRSYPAMADLPAVVRPTRNSKGRTFYRFQVGTTSQAHSEVLCQRMQKIHFSCAVVGLPWKAKVER